MGSGGHLGHCGPVQNGGTDLYASPLRGSRNRHGGSLWADSEAAARGSRFVFHEFTEVLFEGVELDSGELHA